jgi:hypothetical protein
MAFPFFLLGEICFASISRQYGRVFMCAYTALPDASLCGNSPFTGRIFSPIVQNPDFNLGARYAVRLSLPV